MSTFRVFAFTALILSHIVFGACGGDPFKASPAPAPIVDPPAPCPMPLPRTPGANAPASASASHAPAPIGSLPPPPAPGTTGPVLKLPTKGAPEDPAPDPDAPETDDYVTDIILWSEQLSEDGVLPLARGDMAGPATLITATAAMATPNGDFFEVGGYFHWQSDAPDWAHVGGQLGPTDNVGLAFGSWDLFDSGGSTEPISRIQACVENVCPKAATNCPSWACSAIHAAGVINLEGTWYVDGGGFCGDTMVVVQDGRIVMGDEGHIKHGLVLHRTVSFDRQDMHYEGILAWDRDHIEGQVWEMMTLTYAGTWTATRLSAP